MVEPASNPKSGFTVLELIISVSLLLVITVGLGKSMQRSLGLFRTTSADLAIERRFERAIDRLRRELRNASATNLTPIPVAVPGGPTPWTDVLDVRRVDNWVGDAPVLGETLRIEAPYEAGELDNNADDDGDGLVDERELVLTFDATGAMPRRITLASGVLEWFPGETFDGTDENGNGLEDEPGACFVIDGQTLTLRVAIGKVLEDGTEKVRSRTIQLLLSN